MYQKEYSVANKNVPIDALIEMYTYDLVILLILTGQGTCFVWVLIKAIDVKISSNFSSSIWFVNLSANIVFQ